MEAHLGAHGAGGQALRVNLSGNLLYPNPAAVETDRLLKTLKRRTEALFASFGAGTQAMRILIDLHVGA